MFVSPGGVSVWPGAVMPGPCVLPGAVCVDAPERENAKASMRIGNMRGAPLRKYSLIMRGRGKEYSFRPARSKRG